MTEKLGTMIVVGATRFSAGCKVATAQDAIDRMAKRSKEMYALLDRARVFKHRLPPAFEADLDRFFSGTDKP